MWSRPSEAEDGGVEPQPARVHPCSKRRSRHREFIFQVAEGVGVEPERLRVTRFSGPVSAPRRPHLPEQCLPESWDHASRVPPAGLEPAHRVSETRVTSTCGGEIDGAFGRTRTCSLRGRSAASLPTRPRRRSSPGNRTPPPGVEDPSPIHRASHRNRCAAQVQRLATLTAGSKDRNRTGHSRIASAARPLGTCLPSVTPGGLEPPS